MPKEARANMGITAASIISHSTTPKTTPCTVVLPGEQLANTKAYTSGNTITPSIIMRHKHPCFQAARYPSNLTVGVSYKLADLVGLLRRVFCAGLLLWQSAVQYAILKQTQWLAGGARWPVCKS